jgi:dTDP-4-dehydrorhamnose reductase
VVEVMLLTGGSGRLGSALKLAFPDALFPTRKELDLLSAESVANYIKKVKPSAVIHAAAMTSIRACEDDKVLCWKTNTEGTYHLVKACLEHCPQTSFLYVSTPCVFDGKRGSYVEEDLPAPKNMYGLSKLMAEQVCRVLPKHLIVRTNFVAKAPWPYEGAFTDRFGTYLFAKDVAQGLKELLASGMTGIVHLIGDKKLSMYDLAVLCGSNPKKITMADYSGPDLPVDMSLETTRWKRYSIGG